MPIDLNLAAFTPSLPAYGRHIFICTHGNCAPRSHTDALFKRLHELNEQHDRVRFSQGERIVVTQCGCLGVCTGGPLLVVYPDGVWYAHVDETRLARIYQEHLLEGRPVEEYILHRHYPAGQEVPYAPDLRPAQAVDPLLALAEKSAAEKATRPRTLPPEPVSERVRAARARRRNRGEQREPKAERAGRSGPDA